MRIVLVTLPIVILSACATPRERCISHASSNLYNTDAQIKTAEENISRGYAIANTTEERILKTTCTHITKEQKVVTRPCTETETINHSHPVAIDINAERQKLADLRQRRIEVQKQRDRAVSHCVAAHPK